jgi:hypothetical protein
MPQDLFEHCPLQILCYEDLRGILSNEINTYPGDWHTKVARQRWRRLARIVEDAMLDAFRRGRAACGTWLPRLAEELERIEARHRTDVVREIYQTYMELLDRIYGAIYRHVLHNVPTAVVGTTGRLHLSRLVIYRYARLRNADKPALQELMELVYEGTELKMEAEFSWQPLGEGLGQPDSWQRRVRK